MALLPGMTRAPLNLAAVRADFPTLARQVDGRPLSYLDSAATTQKPRAVLEAMDAYYRTSAVANVPQNEGPTGRQEGPFDSVASRP